MARWRGVCGGVGLGVVVAVVVVPFEEGGRVGALLGLPSVHLGVDAVEFEELLVCALLGDGAVDDDGDEVGVEDGGEAVGDDDGGAVAEDVAEGVLDERLGLRVEGGGGLVEDEDLWVLEDGSCE